MTAYEDNFTLAETVIHEMDHYNNFKFNYYQGNSKIARDLNELSAYSAAAEWAGYMKKQGYVHARNVAIYFSLFHF